MVLGYRRARLDVEATWSSVDLVPDDFHRDEAEVVIGHGVDTFARACDGLRIWKAHRGAGVDVLPADAVLEPGATVALRTRQLGLWVVAACRVESVVDEHDRFAFTYATLPDHPEQGVESFEILHDADTDDVRFRIHAVSRGSTAILRLGTPVVHALQRRALADYLDALHRWTSHR